MKTVIFSYDLCLFIMPVSFTSVMQTHIAKVWRYQRGI